MDAYNLVVMRYVVISSLYLSYELPSCSSIPPFDPVIVVFDDDDDDDR